MAQVIDASVAVAWCVPSQATPATTAALQSAIDRGGHVPAQFWFQVLHSLARAERRGSVGRKDVDEFCIRLAELSLTIDSALDGPGMLRLQLLSRRYGTSIYDASYLDLAMRLGLPLATRDATLARAAERAGAVLFTP